MLYLPFKSDNNRDESGKLKELRILFLIDFFS